MELAHDAFVWESERPLEERLYGPACPVVAVGLGRGTTWAEVVLLRGWLERVGRVVRPLNARARRALALADQPAARDKLLPHLFRGQPGWSTIGRWAWHEVDGADWLRRVDLVLLRQPRVALDPWAPVVRLVRDRLWSWSQPSQAADVLAEAEADLWARSWS